MQKIGDQLPRIKKQETIGWNQHGVGDTGSNIRKWIHNIHELIEKPTTIGLDCNKQMPRNIEWSKRFPAQIEKIGKIE